MTAIIIVEILLLVGMAGFVFWFNTKKYKEMQDWRARKSEIAHLLQGREEAEKQVQELRQTSAECQNSVNNLRQETKDLTLEIALQKER